MHSIITHHEDSTLKGQCVHYPNPIPHHLLSNSMKQLKKPNLLAEMNPIAASIALLFVAVCWGAVSVQAATVNWISAADSYTNKAAWSSGNLPLAADTAAVGNATVLSG